MPRFLPHALQAYVDRGKIVEYLLASSHPEGWSKAKFFSRQGFTIGRWKEFADALIQVGVENPVRNEVESAYGTRYTIDGRMHTPAGYQVAVRTIWFIEKRGGLMDGAPRLITAYPA